MLVLQQLQFSIVGMDNQFGSRASLKRSRLADR